MCCEHLRLQQEGLQGDSVKKKHTSQTAAKSHALRSVEQEVKEKAAMKRARRRFPNDPQKAKVEADLILLAELCQSGRTLKR